MEVENEKRERVNFAVTKKQLQKKHNVREEDILRFMRLVQSLADQGFSNEWEERWNFIGALFFSGTVVTTIGKCSYIVLAIGISVFAVTGLPTVMFVCDEQKANNGQLIVYMYASGSMMRQR